MQAFSTLPSNATRPAPITVPDTGRKKAGPSSNPGPCATRQRQDGCGDHRSQ